MVSPRLYYCQPLSDLQPISYILPLFAAILTEFYTQENILFSLLFFSKHLSAILAICFDEKLIARGDDRVILSLAPVPGDDI